MRKNFSGACGSSAGNDAGGRGEREGEMTETPAASGAPAAHGPDYGIVERMRVARALGAGAIVLDRDGIEEVLFRVRAAERVRAEADAMIETVRGEIVGAAARRAAREARLERWSWICLALIAAVQVNAALLPVAQAVLAAFGLGPGPGGE